MLSSAESPVQIQGISFAELPHAVGMNNGANPLQSEFARVIADLNLAYKRISLENADANGADLNSLNLPRDLAGLLQKLVNSGKNMPEAAEDVLQSLQQRWIDHYSDDLESINTGLLESLQQQMTELLQLLPEDVQQLHQQQLELLRQLTEQITDQLRQMHQQDKAQTDNSNTQHTQADNSNTQHTQADGVTHQAELADKPSDRHQAVDGDRLSADLQHDQRNDHAQQPPPTDSETAVIATADTALNPVAQKAQQAESKASSAAAAAAVQNSTTASASHANLQTGVQNSLQYGESAETNIEALARQAVENRMANMPLNTSQQMQSRLQFAQLEQGLTIQGQAKPGGGGESAGFANFQSSGNPSSFTQLMTQSLPQPMTQNLHRPEWGQALGQRITWMIGNKLQAAQLRITPAHLGPIDIRISIEKNVAQVAFVSNHQVVRDALEQAIPRLRDMLDNQNLELGDVDISDGRQQQGPGQSQDFADHAQQARADVAMAPGNADKTLEPAEADVSVTLEQQGLLDAYA